MEIAKDIVVTIVSSTKCAKCRVCKEHGVDFIEGRSFNTDFYAAVLSSKRVELQEVIFNGDGIFAEDIVEINTWSMDSFIPEQINLKSYSKGNNGRCIRYEHSITTNEPIEHIGMYAKEGTTYKKRVLMMSFMTYVSNVVPMRMYNFVLLFPGFIISSAHEWKNALNSPSTFFKAHSVGCPHVWHLDSWIVDSSDNKADNRYLSDPIPIIDEYLKDVSKLLLIPQDQPTKSRPGETRASKYTSTDTTFGDIRGNDGDVPFSNGLDTRYVPRDFNTIYFHNNNKLSASSN